MKTLVLLLLLASASLAGGQSARSFEVKDQGTAIKIAKVALEHEFGSAELKKLKWFEASLHDGKWTVVGHPYKRGAIPTHGGSFDVVVEDHGGCVVEIRAEM